MAIYAIGDLQGCYQELQDLLNEINFDSSNDRLWFAGDLVNRGTSSLACLQFVREYNEQSRVVLGNHELHLLAVANKVRPPRDNDTLDAILARQDSDDYLSWIRKQPLIITDESTGFSLLHAGLFPQWPIEQALDLADEAEQLLQGDQYNAFIQVLYDNKPDRWSDRLTGFDRIRCIINCFTRMRYLNQQGQMDFSEKGAPGSQPNGLFPWYQHPDRKTRTQNIIFGHWSTIHLGYQRDFSQYNVYPVDTGCIWGGGLTAFRLQDRQWFSVPSRKTKIAGF